MDGLEVCRRLRAKGERVPIIMLTAKSEEIDKVLGLELGADDYITKPFSMREFRSRVKAALRRAGMAAADGDDERADRDARPADRSRASARSHCGGDVVPTTFVEFEILAALARSPGPRVHPRHAALAGVGRLRLSRPAHDRRAHPPSAREDRGATPRSPSTCSPCEASDTASATKERMAITRRLRSLRNRLALIFALIILAAIGGDLPVRDAAAAGAPAAPRSSSACSDGAPSAWRRASTEVAGTAAPTARVHAARPSRRPRAPSARGHAAGPGGRHETVFLPYADSSRTAAPRSRTCRRIAARGAAHPAPGDGDRPDRAIGRMALAAWPLFAGKQVARTSSCSPTR